MNKFLRLATTIAASLLFAGCHGIKNNPPAQAAFNGRDLTGWTFFLEKPELKMSDVWSVRDGILVCKGEPLGYLASERSYTNLRLVVEWRWAPGAKPGNSGVLLRINGQPRPLPRCLESQLQSGNAGDLLGLQGMGITGDAARLSKIADHAVAGDITIVKKLTALENPPGEWNRYEIELRDSSLKAWVNGTLANEASGCEILTGPFALQSEGGEIHFRKVEVVELK